jgi:DNA-directed RNA polymerase subunit RPC12/RpoP
MSCAIEMLPCDRCGREVERYNIYLVKNEEGEREFACAECAGQQQTQSSDSQPDCS